MRRSYADSGPVPTPSAGGNLGPVLNSVLPGIGVSNERFYREFYLRRDYMRVLPPDVTASITDWIDWELMER